MPLPSSGGIIARRRSCGMLERLRLGRRCRAVGADRAHLLAEAWRRAFADRFLLGDPATAKANAAQLLDPAWLDRRAAGDRSARGPPRRRGPPLAGRRRQPGESGAVRDHPPVGGGRRRQRGGADHDPQRPLRLRPATCPRRGFLLNNEMDDFATAPGRPNLFGLVQGEANAVAPGKRMLSSMSPTIAWRGAEAVALGRRGGSRIPTAHDPGAAQPDRRTATRSRPPSTGRGSTTSGSPTASRRSPTRCPRRPRPSWSAAATKST